MTATKLQVYIGSGPDPRFDTPNWTIERIKGPDGEDHYVASPNA